MTTKKDFESTARIIAGLIADASAGQPITPFREGVIFAARDMAEKFAYLYAADNPRFDRARFLKACGLCPAEAGGCFCEICEMSV